MSYTINPNAKNKWARNAENTMDLSLETDASSVYLDNGRTLEQEIGEGSMVSNVATVDTSMSKVVDGTLDGAYESCVFKGKSLVNLMTNCKDEYVVRYHDPSNPNNTVANISMMKPNTEYTLFYKAKYRLEGDGAGEMGTLHIATSVEQGFIGASHNLTTEYKQYVFKLTTTSTVDCFTFKSNGSYFAIKECVLLEGDYTNQDVPFFEGLCDVKMPILRNVGKNLFDGELEMGGYTGSSGSPYDSDIRVRSVEKIFLSKGTYTLSSDGATKTIFTIYDLNGVFKKEFVSNNSSCTITLNEDCMVHICVENEKLLNSHIQLEQGSNATIYESYKTNILRTSEEIVLREVNGIQDTYNPLTGEYVRRIGENVFDGSDDESITIFNNTFTNVIWFKLLLSNNTTQANSAICDRFKTDAAWGDYEEIQNHANSKNLFVGIKRDRLDTEDVNGFKTWLSQNPITVQYELAEPITTIVEPSTILFAYENGHIILESGYEGQSLLPTLEYSTVVNKTGLIENVAKTIQAQEKQLTMLEQMLIQNIINLDYNNTLLTLKNEMEEML